MVPMVGTRLEVGQDGVREWRGSKAIDSQKGGRGKCGRVEKMGG